MISVSKFIKTFYPAIIILVILTAFCLYGFYEARITHQDRRSKLFEIRVQRATETIRNRMTDYTQILKGCQSLFYASDSVTQNDWHIYTNNLSVSESYPGILGLAYAPYALKSSGSELENRIRLNGFPSFTIKSTFKNNIITPVIFIEPLTYRNKRALGFDLSSDPSRKKAIERAIQTGQAAITNKVKLVQETNKEVQPGLLMFLPIYRNPINTLDKDTNNVLGLVSAAFRTHDLMNALLKRYNELDIEIYDGDNFEAQNLIYDSNSHLQAKKNAEKLELSSDTSVVIAGSTWRIFYNSNLNFNTAFETQQHYILLIAGLSISSLLFLLAVSTIKRRADIVLQLELSKKLENKKDEFIGIASHELKTPLTSIKAYIQLLEREHLNDKERGYVKKASSQITKLSGLINDLLDVSKIQAGKLQLNNSNFLLSELINDSIESVEHMFTSHVISKPNVIHEINIFGDKFRLEQALTNFLVNAIKYSPGKNTVCVNTRISKFEITIEVIDEGIGISPDNQQKIFDRFFRAEELLPSQSGLGIGLYITNEIVKRHQGYIGVRSELNKGSTFYLTLPTEANAAL